MKAGLVPAFFLYLIVHAMGRNMSAPIPIHLQFNDEEKNRVATLFKEGKTQAQISTILNKLRRLGKVRLIFKVQEQPAPFFAKAKTMTL